MNRRNFIKLAGAASLAVTLPGHAARGQEAPGSAAAGEAATFSEDWLVSQAQNLAAQPYSAPVLELPSELAELDQKQYRAIRFKPDATMWKDQPSKFSLQFFHTGFQYKTPVDMYLIEDGNIRAFPYAASLFDFAEPLTPPPPESKSGFSGVSIAHQIHQQNSRDPFLMFQGASFFRALASGQVFGAIARAVSVNTAQASGEEFPVFRSLWIQKPGPDDRHITIYGLLDGPSLTGAYKFRTEPGRMTNIEVECSLFPRRELPHVGIAPLNSMYFFGSADRTQLNDYRPNVHSSQGLQIWNAGGEWIWRPLTNPEALQYSVFVDGTPKGFGLLQRKRAFSDYEDLDGRFGDRPSVWVEPLGTWGDGAIDLIEVPSGSEIYDNIITFWRPRTPLPAMERRTFRYRLHWGWAPPLEPTLASVLQTRIGSDGADDAFIFVIDFVSGHSCNDCNLTAYEADIRIGDGEIRNVAVRNNKATGGQRVTFQYLPEGGKQTDLRCQLKQNGQVVSETWVYRWTT
jgi:glucans biosynthesis protein